MYYINTNYLPTTVFTDYVENQAYLYYIACFWRLETVGISDSPESIKQLLCHTDTPFFGCSCRAVGKVVVPLLSCRWIEERVS